MQLEARFAHDIDMAAGDEAIIVAIAAIDHLPLCHGLGQPHEMIGLVVGKMMRRGCAQHRIGQFAAGRGAHRLAVEGGAFAHPPGPAFAGNRLVDNAQHGEAILQQADQRAEDRAPGDEAGGAVDRVEHPLAPRAFVARAVFFADDAVIEPLRLQNGAHRGLCRLVRFGHETAVGFLLLAPFTAEQGADRLPGGIGETVCEFEIRRGSHKAHLTGRALWSRCEGTANSLRVALKGRK